MIQRLSMLLLAVTLVSCGTKEKTGDTLPVISVSILPQQYFIQQIAGDQFQINVMVPPGASPATYEPTPSQLADLMKTDLYLKMGFTGFEMVWMKKLMATNTDMMVVELSEGVDLIMDKDHHHGHGHAGSVDPHVWLSPKNVKIISTNVYKALSAVYPEQEKLFSSNLLDFLNRVDSLDNYITEALSGLENRCFMTYHPSLSYFSRDYNLTQYPLELEGKTPTAAYLKELVDIGKKEKVSTIFLQMQFDQHNAEVVAREIGAEIVQINPLDPEWYQQMIFITENIIEKQK